MTVAYQLQTPSSTGTVIHRLELIPNWWEGESLYGWCSRLHALRSGKTRSHGSLLFGHEHACRIVDLPTGMARFGHVTKGLLGSTESILRTRTAVSAYWPFASDATRQQLLDAADDVIGTSITMVLGLPASRLGAFHPLRYCAACHRDALSNHGYSTWQIAQQLPGVWWCPQHRQPLEQVTAMRAIWRQPGVDSQPLGDPKSPEEAHALSLMQALSNALINLERVSPVGLAASVLHRLRAIGMANSPARLNTAKLSAWMQNSPIYQWMLRQGNHVTRPANNWVIPLIRGRSRAHPLKWLILWTSAWQSESVETAVQALVDAATDAVPCEQSGQMLLWIVGQDVPQIPELPLHVEASFLRANTMRDVATELNSNIRAVRQWLSDYPTLAEQWLARLREHRFMQAKAHVAQVIAERPTISRSELLKTCHTDVEWLARHAPASLRQVLNRLPAKRAPQCELF